MDPSEAKLETEEEEKIDKRMALPSMGEVGGNEVKEDEASQVKEPLEIKEQTLEDTEIIAAGQGTRDSNVIGTPKENISFDNQAQ